MTRTAWVILACAACAANPAAEPVSQSHPPAGNADLMYTGSQLEFKLAHDTQLATAALSATKAQAWKALVVVYQDLGFAVGFANQDAGRIGNESLVFNRTIAGEPASKYFDCGYGAAGPRTSTHRLRVSITNTLEAAGEQRTLLHTQLQAAAHSNEGASAVDLPCTTTGALEQRLSSLVAARLLPPAVPRIQPSR